jgi:polygalacturonase
MSAAQFKAAVDSQAEELRGKLNSLIDELINSGVDKIKGVRITVDSTPPSNPHTRDIWIDTVNLMIKMWNGSTWITIVGGDGSGGTAFAIKNKSFIATSGQTLFSISDVGSYEVGKNFLSITVGNVPQNGNIVETSTTSFTIPGGVDADVEVYAQWFQGVLTESDALTLREDIDVLKADVEQRGINVRSYPYYAKGDGITDDTTSINNAIVYAHANGIGTVYFPAGTYMIQGATGTDTYRGQGGGIKVLSNIRLVLDTMAVLKQIPTIYGSYNIIYFVQAENSSIYGGTIIGDRSDHNGVDGEWGYGIGIFSSSNIKIENVTIKDCWGDGINTNMILDTTGLTFEESQCRDITVDNVKCINNRRQGFSIESLIGGKVTSSNFSLTNGTVPSCGIDIEPQTGRVCEDIVISDCFFEENTASGILVLTERTKRITVETCVFKNNGAAEGQYVAKDCSGLIFTSNHLFSPLGGGGARFTNVTDVNIAVNEFRDCTPGFFGCTDVKYGLNSVVYVDKNPSSFITIENFSSDVCENITIESSTFMSKSAVATNNVFANCVGKNIIVKNNHFGQARSLMSLTGTGTYAEIKGNFVIDMSIEGINVADSTSAIIEGNTFSGIGFDNNAQSIVRVRDNAVAKINENTFYKDRLGGGDLGTGRPSAYVRIEVLGLVTAYGNSIDTLTLTNLGVLSTIIRRISYRIGTTSQRPSNNADGDPYYDTTLDKPIWWNGSTWKDAMGTSM